MRSFARVLLRRRSFSEASAPPLTILETASRAIDVDREEATDTYSYLLGEMRLEQ